MGPRPAPSCIVMWTRFQLATTFDTSVQRGREVLAIGPEVAFPRGNDDIEPTD